MDSELINRQTQLSGNIVMLCRFLRDQGYLVGVKEEAEILNLLDYEIIKDRHNMRLALKVAVAKNEFQFKHFDDDFDEFWNQLAKGVDSKIKHQANRTPKKQNDKTPSLDALKSWLYNQETTEELSIARFSPLETLTKKDFSSMDEEELRLISQLLKRITRQMANQKSRLRVRSKKKLQVDLRQTIRANMRAGGDLQYIRYSQKKEKRLKLVIIADVSKSMELYSRFFIHLIYAFQNAYDRINTWVFSTAVHNVSSLLNNYEFEQAYKLIAERVPQWSGGTKTGACLEMFNQQRRGWTIDKKTIVFIISDGWDTGEPDVLSHEMSVIHKRSRKVIWLNPLAGNPNFSPEVSGLKAALPYIDAHIPCHNLESLKNAMSYMKHRRRKLTR